MTLQSDGQLINGNATAIVLYRYKANTAAQEPQGNVSRTCVQSVVNQFSNHRGRTLNDLSCGDLANQHIGKFSNGSAGLRLGHPQIVGVPEDRDNPGMDTLLQLLDFVLHVDRYLLAFVENYGMWVYALLFLIIFVETGLVVMPFLPGDSLLFVVGALCGTGVLDLPTVMALLLVAAIAGDQVNYRIGRYFGPKVFQWENSRFFNRAAFDKAHHFYETYGGITIVLARFMPFIRTFVPFVAGVAAMTPSRFVAYNVLGGFIWVCGLTTAGYLFGETDFVKAHLSQIIWAMIFVPGLFALFGIWRARKT